MLRRATLIVIAVAVAAAISAGGNAFAGSAQGAYFTAADAAHEAALAEDVSAPSAPGEAAPRDWIDWNGADFFGPCQGDCSVTLSGGRQITTAMTRIMLIHNAVPPWQWHWGDAGIVDGEFSRRLVTFWHALDIEPQLGIGKRFGDMQAVEFWGALAFRWTAFPWNDYVKTTIAISEGISLATQVDTVERDANPNRAGSVFLNYFSPEITFALPNYSRYELVLSIHHRSGLYGLIDHVNAGSQFGTMGVRVHF